MYLQPQHDIPETRVPANTPEELLTGLALAVLHPKQRAVMKVLYSTVLNGVILQALCRD